MTSSSFVGSAFAITFALLSLLVLLALLALLVVATLYLLHLLLDRHGVDTRAGAIGFWKRLRAPASAAGATKAAPQKAGQPGPQEGGASRPAALAARAKRTPYSARFGRSDASSASVPEPAAVKRPADATPADASASAGIAPVTPAAVETPVVPESLALRLGSRDAETGRAGQAAETEVFTVEASSVEEQPIDAPTEVLPTTPAPRAARPAAKRPSSARSSSSTATAGGGTRARSAGTGTGGAQRRPAAPTRTPPSATEPPAAPTSAGTGSTTDGTVKSGPTERDSAMDRLFAPLLDSDRTEPLQPPRPAVPLRRADDA